MQDRLRLVEGLHFNCCISNQEKPGYYDQECLLHNIKSGAHFTQR